MPNLMESTARRQMSRIVGDWDATQVQNATMARATREVLTSQTSYRVEVGDRAKVATSLADALAVVKDFLGTSDFEKTRWSRVGQDELMTIHRSGEPDAVIAKIFRATERRLRYEPTKRRR